MAMLHAYGQLALLVALGLLVLLLLIRARRRRHQGSEQAKHPLSPIKVPAVHADLLADTRKLAKLTCQIIIQPQT